MINMDEFIKCASIGYSYHKPDAGMFGRLYGRLRKIIGLQPYALRQRDVYSERYLRKMEEDRRFQEEAVAHAASLIKRRKIMRGIALVGAGGLVAGLLLKKLKKKKENVLNG
jgi:hypothetical protein